MTKRDIDRMPLSKQLALVAHLYKCEFVELVQLLGRAVTEVAMVAASMFYAVANYYTHRPHVPRHR